MPYSSSKVHTQWEQKNLNLMKPKKKGWLYSVTEFERHAIHKSELPQLSLLKIKSSITSCILN